MQDQATPPLWKEGVGWVGSALIAGAYVLLSIGWLEAGVWFQLMNATGAAGVMVICQARRAWAPFALNSFWLVVGLASLARIALG